MKFWRYVTGDVVNKTETIHKTRHLLYPTHPAHTKKRKQVHLKGALPMTVTKPRRLSAVLRTVGLPWDEAGSGDSPNEKIGTLQAAERRPVEPMEVFEQYATGSGSDGSDEEDAELIDDSADSEDEDTDVPGATPLAGHRNQLDEGEHLWPALKDLLGLKLNFELSTALSTRSTKKVTNACRSTYNKLRFFVSIARILDPLGASTSTLRGVDLQGRGT